MMTCIQEGIHRYIQEDIDTCTKTYVHTGRHTYRRKIFTYSVSRQHAHLGLPAVLPCPKWHLSPTKEQEGKTRQARRS